MRSRSATWARLGTNGNFRMETVAEINGTTYSSISAPVIDRALFTDKLSVGNCITSTLKLSVLTNDDIPRSATVVIRSRISDDTDTSEWLTMGTFYIDNRTTNNGMTTLTCYDAMLKASQKYVDETITDGRIGWPHTMQSCVNEIAQRMGLTLDPRTTIRTGNPYQVDYPAKLTMMQVLGYIGACHGGNWIITPENKLRLVPLVAPRTGSETHPAGGGVVTVPVVTGSIKTGKPLTISRVTLGYDSEIGYTNGNDTGHELRIENNPYASQAICNDLYAALNGLQYVPYQLDGACYDPAAELGDWLTAGDVSSVLFAQTATHNVNFRCNVNAPGKEEASSEYPHLTTIERLQQKDEQLQKYIENAETEFNSSIEQTRQQIVLEANRATGVEEQLSARITVNAESIASEVTRAENAEDALSSKIEQTAGSIRLSVTNSASSSTITLTGDGIEAQSETITFTGGVVFKSDLTDGTTTISGDNITAGKIQSKNGLVYFDLENDELVCSAIKGKQAKNDGDLVIGTSVYYDDDGKPTYRGATIFKDGYRDNGININPSKTGAGSINTKSLDIDAENDMSISGGDSLSLFSYYKQTNSVSAVSGVYVNPDTGMVTIASRAAKSYFNGANKDRAISSAAIYLKDGKIYLEGPVYMTGDVHIRGFIYDNNDTIHPRSDYPGTEDWFG